MPDFHRLTRIQMLASIRDYPTDTMAEVLEHHGLEASAADVMVVERGQRYDARVLVATAYERVLGERLIAGDLPSDLAGLMARLEFKVVSRHDELASETAKAERRRVPGTPRAAATPRARATTAAPARPAPPVCPTCMMQLRAGSSVCENCG